MLLNLIRARFHNREPSGIIPTEKDLKNAKRYKHVVIFGVDGGGYHFEDYDLPNFRKIHGNGNVSYRSQSQFPTISAENWTAILHGVHFQTHKIDNYTAARKDFGDSTIPSIFKLYGERHKDACMASIVNWYPINKGIIEHNIPGMYKINAHEIYKGPDDEYAIDQTVCDEALKFIEDKEPTILYLHFDGPDHGAHSKGFGSEEFKKAMKLTDGHMGKIYDAYCKKGWKDNTLFITVTDHGQRNTRRGGGTHGGWSSDERLTTLAVAGGLGDIIKGTHAKSGTVDVASIVLYALGEKQPANMVSSIPMGMFNTLKR